MIEKHHIDWYREDLDRAKREADRDIETALNRAKVSLCPSCDYCAFIVRHQLIVEQVYEDVRALIERIVPGSYSSRVFSKQMWHDGMNYRGFIADNGDFLPIFRGNHQSLREEYAQKYGWEQAYKLINIHGRGPKTHVLFCDRKYAPTEKQYETLKNLMIDAEGTLTFQFELDTRHPHRA